MTLATLLLLDGNDSSIFVAVSVFMASSFLVELEFGASLFSLMAAAALFFSF